MQKSTYTTILVALCLAVGLCFAIQNTTQATPVLELTKSASVNANVITYTLTISNNSTETATTIILQDPLPLSTSFDIADNNGFVENGVVQWPSIDTLPAGTTIVRTFSVLINSIGSQEPPLLHITTPITGNVSTEPSVTISGFVTDADSTTAAIEITSDNGYTHAFNTTTTLWSVDAVPLQSGTNTFTVTATDVNGNTQQQEIVITHTPIASPDITLSANPTSLPAGGGEVTLDWGVSNATLCIASGGPWSGEKNPQIGSETLILAQTTTFTLTCQNSTHTTANSVTVIVDTISPTNDGIWISTDEIMALPMSGVAWDNLLDQAESSWGSACLDDNDCQHDVKTLAGALVAVRSNDQAMHDKVINGLRSAMQSDLSRALELSRGLQSYIIAADIINYHDTSFENWVRQIIDEDITGHSGGSGVRGTAIKSSNNWGGHARASLAAAAIYLDDALMIEDVVGGQKDFIGTDGPGEMNFTDTNWHATNDKAGVNRTGSTIENVTVSGVLTEDWRRGGSFAWPPDVSGYMWEGMQGFVVTAVLLHRANLVPFTAGDNAVVRAMNMLYGLDEAASNNPIYINSAEGDDRWIPWVVNYYAGTDFSTESTTPGKGMGYTDWTHQ